MPGDTPQEAVTAFLNPLKSAVCVLDGPGAITVNRRGGWVKGETYSWVLNAGHGMKLGNVGTVRASMRFRVIDTAPATNDFGKRLWVPPWATTGRDSTQAASSWASPLDRPDLRRPQE
jgi:hypothetical protein